jgi:hypothetical protein
MAYVVNAALLNSFVMLAPDGAVVSSLGFVIISVTLLPFYEVFTSSGSDNLA